MIMDRRRFLAASGLGGFASITDAAPVVTDGPRILWRLPSSTNKTLDVTWNGLQTIARRVGLATGGRFQIQVFASGELLSPFGVFDAVSSGTVPIGFGASFYYVGKDPAFAFDCAMPFGLNYRQHMAWLMQGGGMELLREFYRDYRAVNLPCANTGAQPAGWFRREIRDVTDLKGLKYRASGLAGQVLARLGVTPQAIPVTDVYPALERGTIDAAKLAAPHDDERAGIYNVARYYYFPGWAEGNNQLSIYINLDAWNSLPPSYQAILVAECHRNAVDTMAAFDVANPASLARMVAKGAQVRRFPGDVFEAAHRVAHDLYDSFADSSPRFRKIYDHWRRFRARQVAWYAVAERPYDGFLAAHPD